MALLLCVPLTPAAIAAVQTGATGGVAGHPPGRAHCRCWGERLTLAALLTGRCRDCGGEARIGGVERGRLSTGELARTVTYGGFAGHLFSGTAAENLHMGCPEADDAVLWRALERTRTTDFPRGEQGLGTHLGPQGANLSGGRRQRLALARALLHGTPIYIFDEATSNSDVGSENDIIAEIHALAGEKTVLLVSHRPANVAAADCICVPGPGRGPPPFWPECQVWERVA